MQRIILEFAYDEAKSVEEALRYMASTILGVDEDDVPEEVVKFGSVVIMEYLAGNLKTVQSFYIDEDDAS